jgi:dTDP-3-amino-3,4,6-trideoxy-alpha-D-glucose transaminase
VSVRTPARVAVPHVPLLDLRPSHKLVAAPILADIARLIDSNEYTNGPQVDEFERAFAGYCGTAECVGLASGLDALRVGLVAAGIEPGDEVVVPANTFVATLEAVTQAGGRPVVVDVTDHDYNLDVAEVEAAIGSRTRFVLPVHLYGQLADVRSLVALAARAGIRLVEDACQGHGGERDGIRAGTAGTAGAFSFYPAKNLGAMGDAGALVTDDAAVAARARALREHGQAGKYRHEEEGWTARLDTIQAIVLLRKLPFLDAWNDERAACARFYDEALAGVGDLRLPPVPRGSKPVWHLYVVRTARPDRLAEFLAARGIATGRHYPEPVHLTRAYSRLGYPRGSFPVAEALSAEVLSLPVFPGIREEQLAAVADSIAEYFRHG